MTEDHSEERQAETPQVIRPPIEILLESPAIQEALSKIPDLIQANITARTTITRGTTKTTLVWAAALTLIIVAPVTVLAFYDKVSSDAATFLFGAIVGAVFTFTRTFLARQD